MKEQTDLHCSKRRKELEEGSAEGEVVCAGTEFDDMVG